MAGGTPAFPLRLRDARLRALVREVAQQEGISQNELIEQTVEEGLIVRGRLLAKNLQEAVDRLNGLSKETYAEVLARSMQAFAEGEGQRDPLQSHALHTETAVPAQREASDSPTGDAPSGERDDDQPDLLTVFYAHHR